MSKRLRVAVLGATGSVGRQALEVLDTFRDRFEVVSLAARASVEDMEAAIRRFKPASVAMTDEQAAEKLRESAAAEGCRVLEGPDGLCELAADENADCVLAATAGSSGVKAVWTAVNCGKLVALANKEALVIAGGPITKAAASNGARLLPVDSEHAAAHQLLEHVPREHVRRLILTASGGPFLEWSREKLEKVDASTALDHPRWNMGPKISIDSATMVNKGFEVIEARWLFDLPEEKIDVLIHPQSIAHAIVEMADGAMVSQMAAPDMRIPIAYALSYPDRLELPARIDNTRPLRLDHQRLDFLPLRNDQFPALELCRRALRAGGGTTAAFCSADEVFVNAFLEGRIRFTRIVELLGRLLELLRPLPGDSLEDCLSAAEQGSRLARELLEREPQP